MYLKFYCRHIIIILFIMSCADLMAGGPSARNRLEKGKSNVRGKIYGLGKYGEFPMQRSMVVISSSDKNKMVYSDKEGMYVFHDIPPGSYTLETFAMNSNIPSVKKEILVSPYAEVTDIKPIKAYDHKQEQKQEQLQEEATGSQGDQKQAEKGSSVMKKLKKAIKSIQRAVK